MAAVRQFSNYLKTPFLLLKWKVEAGHQLFSSTTVLTYSCKDGNGDVSDQKLKLKSTTEGVVQTLLVKEGDVVEPGAPLLMLQYCKHDLIIKEICADCGVDLWRAGMYQKLPETDLEVTHKQAEKIEVAGWRELLKKRKLSLLIYMDNILTNEEIKEINADVNKPKTRQGAEDFITTMSQHFDLHLYTRCSLKYANMVLKILNPECCLPCRLWSLDNCHNDMEMSVKKIFPHGDSMVCIVDRPSIDRQLSVPGSAMNLINVNFFNDNVNLNGIATNENEAGKADCDSKKQEPVITNLTECKSEVKDETSSSTNRPDHEVSGGANFSLSYTKRELNSDLFCLQRILLNVHKAYYKLCDQMVKQRMYVINQKAIPDLKNVIPYVRCNVLKGVNIVFSGLTPNGSNLEEMPIYALAKSLGANVTDKIVLHDGGNSTTHVIANKLGTAKTNQARKIKQLFVISPDWLFFCGKCWEKVDETWFLLKKENDNEKLQNLQASTPVAIKDPQTNVSPPNVKSDLPNSSVIQKREVEAMRSSLSNKISLTETLKISSQDLIDMNNEVEEECTSDNSDDDDDIQGTTSKRKSDNLGEDFPCGSVKSKRIKHISDYSSPCNSVWIANGKVCGKKVPVWERAFDSDAVDASESENEYDYIYSEDEDCLL